MELLLNKKPVLLKVLQPLLGKIPEDFERNVDSFEKYLQKYGQEIVRAIEMLGMWEEKDVTIYPIPATWKIPSFSSPLVLKIRENQAFNLYVLIHELIHRFLEKSKLSEKLKKHEMEAFAVFATQLIYSKIFGDEKAKEMRQIEKQIVMTRDEKLIDKIIESRRSYFLKLMMVEKSF